MNDPLRDQRVLRFARKFFAAAQNDEPERALRVSEKWFWPRTAGIFREHV